MNNLSTCPKTHFPVALDSSRETALYSELHLLRSLLPLTSPFAVNSGCPSPTAVTLLGFSPLKSSLTTPRSLNPPRPLGPEHWPSPQTQGLKAKARDQKDFQDPEGPLPPPWPGGTRLTLESAKSTLSAVSSSCMKPARTTSRWSLLLPWPWITEQAQHSWPSESWSPQSAAFPPRRRLLVWGLYLFETSWLWNACQPWLIDSPNS